MNYYLDPPSIKQPGKPLSANILNKVLYIGELPPTIDQYELYQLINNKGKYDIESLTVKRTRDNKSYAYVKFKNRNEGRNKYLFLAERAKKTLHLLPVGNYIITVHNFDPNNKEHFATDEGMSECNLFIKNLPESTTSQEFYDLFSKIGEISSIKLKMDNKGKCIGYGYVEYNNADDAHEAINQLNGFSFNGKFLKVDNFLNIKQRYVENNFSVLIIKRLPGSVK